MTDESTRIAFIDIVLFEDSAIRGGVLVTDNFSRPYEFRVTSPIKPNQLQKILYGNSLLDYVYGELICAPLINQVKENVELVVCRNEHILTARPYLKLPLVYAYKSQNNSDRNGLDQYIIETHKNFPSEKGPAELVLLGLQQNADVLEPFERIKLATQEVHKKKAD